MKKIRYRLVYNRKKLLNRQGKALIQVEASLGESKIYISTRVYVRPEEWDSRTSSVIVHPHADDLNVWLNEFVIKLEGVELSLWKRNITPTLLQIKNAMKGDCGPKLSFRSFCSSCIEKSKRKKSTQDSLQGTVGLLSECSPAFSWEDLNYLFLKDFEHWLREKGYASNTVAKHLRNLRTLVNEAISAGQLSQDDNPFRQYAIKMAKSQHRNLYPEELVALEKLKLDGSLCHIRDAFLFCCYTGLRFSDFKRLQKQHLVSINGGCWLCVKTEKTGCYVQIPLYLIFGGKALKLLERYPDIEKFADIGSNTMVNRKLAKLKELLNTKTKITFHVARHTCATLLCHQGVPITTVQKILGHSDLATTQVYSEIMTDTIVRDLSKAGSQRKINKGVKR